MGLFTKSIVILLIAVSSPLLYRQFANEGTVKFMSSYYSNYKVIDQFLKQSAGQLDQAKDYINTEQLKVIGGRLNEQLTNYIDLAKTKVKEIQKSFEEQGKSKNDGDKDSTKKEKQTTTTTTTTTATPKTISASAIKTNQDRYSQCPGEDLKGQRVRLWSKNELAKFDGSSGGEKIYLGFLGLVYDVTANRQHYQPGAEYNAFAGKDATLAFVTGNFTNDLHDNTEKVDESLFSHIESWASFYNTNYPVVGRIEGKFYDSQGCATKELVRIYEIFHKLEKEKSANELLDKQINQQFPECNSEWNGDLKKGRVWCTNQSGGVERNWIGVPRIYNNGGESQRCACFNLDSENVKDQEKFMSLYPDCDPMATECTLKQ